jgi:hypothetical protein
VKRGVNIENYLKPLAQQETQAYLTNELQVADLLEWILEQLGPSKVWQTSFSISEEFVRRLYFIQKDADVVEYNLILDHKATNKTIKLWPFICQVVSKTYLADNHSKLLLVQSMKGEVASVVTSQNLTRGNRSECAFVSSNLAIFQGLFLQVQQLIKNHSIPLHDLYRQRITAD